MSCSFGCFCMVENDGRGEERTTVVFDHSFLGEPRIIIHIINAYCKLEGEKINSEKGQYDDLKTQKKAHVHIFLTFASLSQSIYIKISVYSIALCINIVTKRCCNILISLSRWINT